MSKLKTVLLLALAAALPQAAAAGGQTHKTARTTLERYADAILTVKVVVKHRYISEGRERNASEAQMELSGTTLTPGGLTVVSDAATNPSSLAASSPGSARRMETETTDVKLVLGDGRELPARFVLRDRDLDLAFVLPDEQGLELPHVDFARDAAAVPQPLDELVYLYPLAKSLNREVAVTLDRVRAVVHKPRTFIAQSLFLGMQSLGCPVFDTTGKVVGLSVLRRAAIRSRPSGSFGDMFNSVTPVVLTAADVHEGAVQALEHAAKQAAEGAEGEKR